MQINTDLHIHSRFSMSVSKKMSMKGLATVAPKKGVQVIGTGDVLHRTWFKEVTDLPEVEEGTYELNGTRFVLTGEVEGKGRIHHLLIFPCASTVEEFRALVSKESKNIDRDGRPNIRLNGEEIAQRAKDVGALIGPAHAFTPWTSMYSVHDSLSECYGDLVDHVSFLELGLSADTGYADRIRELRHLTYLTNSDAHSAKPRRVAREFNRFDVKAVTAGDIIKAIQRTGGRKPVLNVGFPPDLGKYNESACIKCYQHFYLNEAISDGWKCPVCGGRIKKGVWDRVNELADIKRPKHPSHRPEYKHIIPLSEIISDALGRGPETKTVNKEWTKLIEVFNDEVNVLIDAPIEDIVEVAHEDVGRAVAFFRKSEVVVYAGGGGEYGKVVVPKPGVELEPPREKIAEPPKKGQMTLSHFE